MVDAVNARDVTGIVGDVECAGWCPTGRAGWIPIGAVRVSVFSAFVGGHARSQSLVANCSTLQNAYVQALSAGSLSDACLYPAPGYRRFGSVPQVGGKGLFSTAASDSRAFSVTGGRLYEWFQDGSAIDRGAVAVDANPATIYTNGAGGQELAVTAGGNFYVLNLLTNTLTQVAFLNGKATQCGFVSGYFLVFDINTGTVYQSDLYDGTTFDPANFFQRNVQADDWNGMLVASWGLVFLPGTKTRDWYYNAGTFPIPFAPAQSQAGTQGCAAPFSICECGDQVAWLATQDGGGYKVMAAAGGEGIEISKEAICFALSRNTQLEISSAVGEFYSDQGHDFYLLTVGNVTWVYDFKSGEWHQRRSFTDAVSGTLGSARARFHCFAFNKHLWQDADTGIVAESDISYAYDIGDLVMQRQRTTPAIYYQNQELDLGDIELVMETGVGNPNDPGSDPVIWLEISTDGGKTWGMARMGAVGREGQYDLHVRWMGNGGGRKIALRFTMSDPINNWRLLQLLVDVRDERGRALNLEMPRAA